MTGTALRDRLSASEIVVAPGVYDALTALIAKAAGFPALYLSGASIAYTRLGRADIGLVSMNEVADVLAAIRERVEAPLIVDADTGYGNALNVMRTVRVFERCGAAAIQLEDQSLPKRCGHLAGKSLVTTGEMIGKIKAATDARHNDDLLIIARTDAIAVEGFDAALDRAEAYLTAGADILFVEAPQSTEQMQAVCNRFANHVPLLANMVEGGRTPPLSSAELQALGYTIAIFPGGTARLVARQLQRYYAGLRKAGTTAAFTGDMLDFDQLNALIGTPDLLAVGERYDVGRYEPGSD